ncbi:MAG: caspase family protein [Candidatus Binatia bacterium]
MRLAVIGGLVSVAIAISAGAYYSLQYLRPLQRSATHSPAPAAQFSFSATPSVARPTLWVLSIGVSRYKEAGIALQFADADARVVEETFQNQKDGLIYREVKALVLTNEQVTRESVMNGIQRFLGQAGPDDVAVIFMAGHGVQDHATGSYYFLPYPASGDNLLTEGLRMSDFDEMMRVLRRNVHRVVVMLDTCHAGALQLSARAVMSGDSLAARVEAGEGLFLLAAAKPGEESKEEPELGHGAFTYALVEGLLGAADTSGEGFVSVSDLFGYVARRVPRLTAGTQHPYHKIEGTDLMLAAVPKGREARSTPAMEEVAQSMRQPSSTPAPNAIEVTDFRNLRNDPENDWRGSMLRVALCTELSKIRALRVFSSEFIAPAGKADGFEELRAARQLGISKVVRGSFVVQGNIIRIDAGIWDAGTGVNQGSESVEGKVDAFFDLEKELVMKILRRLPVEVSAAEGKSIKEETNTSVDAYKLLLEAEGVSKQQTPPVRQVTPPGSREPQSTLDVPTSGIAGRRPGADNAGAVVLSRSRALEPWALLSGVAYAVEAESDTKTEILKSLEEYRQALEHKDLDTLAALYAVFPDRQREALRAYLANAVDLKVDIADVEITPRGNEVAVSFTRRDQFIDQESGKPTRLEVRLTKIFVREGGKWKIAGGA